MAMKEKGRNNKQEIYKTHERTKRKIRKKAEE